MKILFTILLLFMMMLTAFSTTVQATDLLRNFSVIIINGKFRPESSGKNTDSVDSDISGYGFNSNISRACYITAAATTISAEYRYQYFYNEFSNIEGFEQKRYFQGVTLTIVKSFEL